jgi:hypothetical protein
MKESLPLAFIFSTVGAFNFSCNPTFSTKVKESKKVTINYKNP